jgi:hypothetical protein
MLIPTKHEFEVLSISEKNYKPRAIDAEIYFDANGLIEIHYKR